MPPSPGGDIKSLSIVPWCNYSDVVTEFFITKHMPHQALEKLITDKISLNQKFLGNIWAMRKKSCWKQKSESQN
jgi:hypothetical protein